MKKLISVILAVSLLFTFTLTCFATEEKAVLPTPTTTWGSDIPVVSLFGDGEAICDGGDNIIFKFSEILNMLGSDDGEEGEGDNSIVEAVIAILQPFLVEGLANDEWDNYYAALEKEIGDLFTEVRYDKNGECPNNTDIPASRREQMANSLKTDFKQTRGSYYVYDYQFYYDWRQDPLEPADEFHEYIEGVKAVTGSEKVALLARCLGSSVVISYIAKYGTDSICGIGIDGGVIEGAEIISQSISGKFTLDGEAINRLLYDMNATGSANIDSFVMATIDLAVKSGLIETITENVKETIYDKLVKGVTSALSLSTFFTWPGYWACVAEEDYDAALEHVFGDENSTKRTEYAGLIEKIENYNTTVRQQLDSLYDQIEDSGAKIGIIGKYGFQIAPICASHDKIADQYSTLTKSSLGATTALTIYETLPEDYLYEREMEGKSKYISPDLLVDASTCRFPDYTWFTKNISHSYWHDFETALLFHIITADVQYTVDDFDCTQFVVHDYETGEVSPMTEDNCHTESWYDDIRKGPAETMFERIFAFVRSILTWLLLVLEMFEDVDFSEINFEQTV